MTSLPAGYTVLEDCFSQSECAELIAHGSMLTGAGSRCLLEHAWCQALAGMLRQRLSATLPVLESMAAIQCTYFNKTAAGNWFVAYHQDRSIPVAASAAAERMAGWSVKEGITFVQASDETLARMLALRLHFDDSTLHNGPLRVIPHSHGRGTLSPLEIQEVREASTEVDLTVRRGGVVAMRPLLLHASSKSRIMENRRVLHFLFAPRTPPEGLQWRCTE